MQLLHSVQRRENIKLTSKHWKQEMKEIIAKQRATLYTKCITERRIPKTRRKQIWWNFSRKETEKDVKNYTSICLLSNIPPSKQINGHLFTICLMVWCSWESQSGEVMQPHSCILLRHGPAFVRNLFSRLYGTRGRSIPGSWMVGSLILINYLFGTSTIWFFHRLRHRC